MPVSLLNADTMFPSFTEGTSSSEKIDTVMNYLYMLLEELRYTFGNLGAENFNDASLNELAIQITKPVYGKIEDVEEGLTHEFEVTASSLSSRISSVDGRVTSISATVDGIEMDVVGLNSEVASLSLTVDGFETRISNAEGSVTAISQTVRSIRLEAYDGMTENSAWIQISGDGIEANAVKIEFQGMVTFSDLSGTGTTTINGSNIKTGTIQSIAVNACTITSSTFNTVLSSSGNVSGEIKFYYLAQMAELLAGGIRLDDSGDGTDEDSQYRMFIYTKYVAGSGEYFSLKLKSDDKISIEAATYAYMYGDTVSIRAGNSMTIRSGTNSNRGDLFLWGNVYINGTLIS